MELKGEKENLEVGREDGGEIGVSSEDKTTQKAGIKKKNKATGTTEKPKKLVIRIEHQPEKRARIIISLSRNLIVSPASFFPRKWGSERAVCLRLKMTNEPIKIK